MATDRTFQAKNAQETRRLRTLIARLSDADFGRSLGHAWTVRDALVHLAFWDLRAVTLIERFQKEGVGPSGADAEVLNEAVRALGAAIPPRAAATLAAQAAETVDRAIEGMPDRLIEAIPADDNSFSLTRHVHRAEHLDDIERALR